MSWTVNWIDGLVFLLLAMLTIWFWFFKKTTECELIWKKICETPRFLVALMILALYGIIGLLDCIHFKDPNIHHKVMSVLDWILFPHFIQSEVTYSAPFLFHAYQDISLRVGIGVASGLTLTAIVYKLLIYLCANAMEQYPFRQIQKTFFVTLAFILCSIGILLMLTHEYHVLGTDKIGRDVFYLSVKSIRTGLVIGTVTTLVMLPFALFLGMWAGYFRGWVDDVIQYIYTTISSIPGVLLIAAAMLSFQVNIEGSPDLRLLILCVILGVSSWTTLCRLLRGESFKLKTADFIQSAVSQGVKPFTIVRRHILPNLMHIVIITVVLDFSSLVLAEAVLSYVGVGVDPDSFSWGNMINAARLDMARDPVVWWSLSGALVFMFVLVLSANIFSDALQEALNPKER